MIKEIATLLKETDFGKAVIISVFVLSLIFPGIIFIFQFNKSLFLLDSIKVQILSVGIGFSLQLLVWPAMCMYMAEIEKRSLQITIKSIWNAMLFGGMLVSFELLFVSFIRLWIGGIFQAKLALTILGVLNILILINSIRDFVGRSKQLHGNV
ncbi:MAG: hypothetical protein HYX40_05235 [Sphingobacteriales bacterium]|nr:hypothetical protein [Sphingobacteriales bacterium]